MTDRCEAWALLSDRKALGEALREDERSFLVEHAASCPLCAAEGAVWDDLSGLMDPAPKRERERRRWRSYVLAAAAALLLFVSARAGEHAVRERAPSVVAKVLAKACVSEAAVLEVDGKPAQVGDDVPLGATLFAREGQACLHLEPGVRVCAREGSSFRMASLGDERRLELRSGKLDAELAPQPPGTSFGVLTRDGAAIAVGTAFSVELTSGGLAITRVQHGTVLVRNRSGVEQKVTAHQMTRVDTPTAVRSFEDDQPTVLAEHVRAPERTAKLEPARVLPETARLVAEPARTKPEPVTEVREAAAQRPEPVAEVGAAKTSAEVVHAPSAFQLLSTAREERARRDLRAARLSYRNLLARYAESPEAQAARVAYAEILLSERQALSALRVFEQYLERGGALAEEASFGRIRALRALGQRYAEAKALAQFAQTYPNSPLLTALDRRMRELGVR